MTLSQTLSCVGAVFGAHFATQGFEASRLKVGFEYLEVWAQEPTFEYGADPYSVALLPHAPRSFDVPSIGAQINIVATGGLDTIPDWQRAGLWIQRAIEIVPSRPMPILWFQQQFWLLRLLLSVLMGQHTYPTFITAAAILPSGASQEVTILAVDAPRPEVMPKLGWRQVAFPLPLVLKDSPNFFELWFQSMASTQIAAELFVGALANTEMYPHQHFNSLVHALEAFHRKTANGLYLPEANYKPISDCLAAAIPSAVHTDHRAALKSRIRYGNEYSLNKRLSDLSSSLDESLQELIAPELKAFMSRVVATRNFFTHWAIESQTKPFSSPELPDAARRLTRFLVILLLRKVGIAPGTLAGRLGPPAQG